MPQVQLFGSFKAIFFFSKKMCSDFQTKIESQVELHSKHLAKFNSATRTYFIKNKLAASLSWSVELWLPQGKTN